MNEIEYLLVKVAEECNEVSQRCTKALCFGMDEKQPGQPFDNKERILQEFNDLVAVMEMLFGKPVSGLVDQKQVDAKKSKIIKYMIYSMECGTLE